PAQLSVQVVHLGWMVSETRLNQGDMEGVGLELPARFNFEAYPALEVPAEVVSVGTFVRPSRWRANYVRDVPLRLKLQAEDRRFVPNLSASADIVIESEDQCTLVPRECVFQEAGADFVYVKPEHGRQPPHLQLRLPTN